MRKSIVSSVICVGSLVAVAAIPASRANAQSTVSYGISFTAGSNPDGLTNVDASSFNATDFATQLNIPLFDSTLGTLQKVTIQLDTGFYSNQTVTALADGTTVTKSGVEIDVNVFGGPSNVFGADYDTSTFITATKSTATDVPYTLAHTNDTHPETFGSAASPITGTTGDMFFSTNSGTLNSFQAMGGGTATANAETTTNTILSFSSGNAQAEQTTQAKLSGMVTYQYLAPTPASPGDVTMALGIGIAALTVVRRRKTGKTTPQ